MSLRVLCSPQPTVDDVSLQKLAQFAGLQVQACNGATEDDATADGSVHIAATWQSLEASLRRPSGREWLSRQLATKGSSLFIAGISPSPACLETMEALLPGVVRAVAEAGEHGAEYNVDRAAASGMPQFSGVRFSGVDPGADRTFELGAGAGQITELIRIGQRPCYVRVERSGTSYFLVACSRILDIDAPVRRGREPIDHFLQFVPFLAYLRLTFGARCWRNESRTACFIIDDPLLRERYGFLDFRLLESCMTRSRLSVNIAFIPWNYRRTSRSATTRFTRPDHRLSISVHGCDHTEAEFATTDERALRYRARLALARMDTHEQLTGIRHNRVMVFPQGAFSKASLAALDRAGFVAAVNSTAHAVDETPDELTFRDMLDIAVIKFGGTPLFLRHYPDRLEAIALDLFLGKPVLMVEHHQFFRYGCHELERCAAFVDGIAPDIRWTDLEQACAGAHLVREASAGRVEILAFGSTVSLKNRHGARVKFHVSNSWARQASQVTWEGRAIDFATDPTGARCDLELNPGEAGTLWFGRQTSPEQEEFVEPAVRERVKVYVRRHLCEIRDNYLGRSNVLTELARAGKTFLPRM